jgi:hypothetical protein
LTCDVCDPSRFDLLCMWAPRSTPSTLWLRVWTLFARKAAKAAATLAPSQPRCSFLQVKSQPNQRLKKRSPLFIPHSRSCRRLRGKSVVVHRSPSGCCLCRRHLRRQRPGHVVVLRRTGAALKPNTKPRIISHHPGCLGWYPFPLCDRSWRAAPPPAGGARRGVRERALTHAARSCASRAAAVWLSRDGTVAVQVR